MNDNRSLTELAIEVMTIQDACNLSGVVHAFSRSISRLRELLPNASTDEINNHPVCVMFASKISSLTCSYDQTMFNGAYDACEELMRGASGKDVIRSMSCLSLVDIDQ